MDVNKLCLYCMKEINEDSPEVCPHCGRRRDDSEENLHALQPYTILQGKYLVGEVMGEGGFGITYVGLDLNLETKLAIKEFYPNGLVTRESMVTSTVTNYTGGQSEAQYMKWRDSFVQEARNLARFSGLPGIVNVRDFFQENNTAYIVMEFVEGETLKTYLKSRGGRITEMETLEMMKPVIHSLSKVHEAGLIHRDISPDNIMIENKGTVRLIDFGAARDIGVGDGKSMSVLLKPGYAPEEQYRSKGNQGPWTDVYAMCATIYRCITGEKPVEAMERMRDDTLRMPSELGLSISPNVEQTVLAGLAVFAEKRIQSMDELMEGLYNNRQVRYTADNSERKTSKQSGLNIKKMIIIPGVIVALGLICVFFTVSRKKTDQTEQELIEDSAEEVTDESHAEETTTTPNLPLAEQEKLTEASETPEQVEEEDLVDDTGMYSVKKIRAITLRPENSDTDAITFFFDEAGNMTNIEGGYTVISSDADGNKKEERKSIDLSANSNMISFFEPIRLSCDPSEYTGKASDRFEDGFGNTIMQSYVTPSIFWGETDDEQRIVNAKWEDEWGESNRLDCEYDDGVMREELNDGAEEYLVEMDSDGYVSFHKSVSRIQEFDGTVSESTSEGSVVRDEKHRILEYHGRSATPHYVDREDGSLAVEGEDVNTLEVRQSFDDRDLLITREERYESSEGQESLTKRSYEYDDKGNLIRVETELSDGFKDLVEFEYEDHGRISSIEEMRNYKETDAGKTGGANNISHITYDEEGYPESMPESSFGQELLWAHYPKIYSQYLGYERYGMSFFGSETTIKAEYDYYD